MNSDTVDCAPHMKKVLFELFLKDSLRSVVFRCRGRMYALIIVCYNLLHIMKTGLISLIHHLEPIIAIWAIYEAPKSWSHGPSRNLVKTHSFITASTPWSKFPHQSGHSPHTPTSTLQNLLNPVLRTCLAECTYQQVHLDIIDLQPDKEPGNVKVFLFLLAEIQIVSLFFADHPQYPQENASSFW